MADFQKLEQKKGSGGALPVPDIVDDAKESKMQPSWANLGSSSGSFNDHMGRKQKTIKDLRKDLFHMQQEERKNTLRIKIAAPEARSPLVLDLKDSSIVNANSSTGENPRRRCLALISHNHMKPAMQEFVMANKEVLRHFRLTGTNSTMTMLGQIFEGMEVEFGPTMSSGPLGGDAQVGALLTFGDLGGMIFFADPLSAHPHMADVNSLIRLANVHDVLYALNVTSAKSMIRTLKAGLKDPSLIPSFYQTLESPSVAAYRAEQQALITKLKERQFELEFTRLKTQTLIKSATQSSKASVGGGDADIGLSMQDIESLQRRLETSLNEQHPSSVGSLASV